MQHSAEKQGERGGAGRMEKPNPKQARLARRGEEHRSAAGGHGVVTVVREGCERECCLSARVACPQEHARAVTYRLAPRVPACN